MTTSPQDHTSINVGGSVQRFGACGVVIWVLGNNTLYLANFSQSRLFLERPLMHGRKKWSKSLSFSLSNCKNHACSRLNTTRHATTLISQLPGWSVAFLVGYRLVCWLVHRFVGWSVSWSVINEFLFLASSEHLVIGWCVEWLVGWLVSRLVSWSVISAFLFSAFPATSAFALIE